MTEISYDDANYPCKCDADGVVHGQDMGDPGCTAMYQGQYYCYVSDGCPAHLLADVYQGVNWKYCTPSEEVLPTECANCEPGYSSAASSDAACTPCVQGTYSTSAGATACQSCPEHTPFTSVTEGASSVDSCGPDPDGCLEVTIGACAGLEIEADVSGDYKLYEGDCDCAVPWMQAYEKIINVGGEDMFLYYRESAGGWLIGHTCGESVGWVFGRITTAVAFPFIDTVSEWQCADMMGGFTMEPVAVTCSLYATLLVPECESGTYATGPDATECQACPAHIPFSVQGATSLDDCQLVASTCVQVTADGCEGLNAVSFVTGNYALYEGACKGAKSGSPVYLRESTGVFLYHRPQDEIWILGSFCGSSNFVANSIFAGGEAGSFPFLNTNSWRCQAIGGDFEEASMEIECSLYEGQLAACKPGTHNSSGVGPEGECHPCPPPLESSLAGAKSVAECFTKEANIFTASSMSGTVVAYNADGNDHQLITESGLQTMEIAFINDDEILFNLFLSDRVSITNVEGSALGDFAQIERPTTVLHLPEKNQVAIGSITEKIFFFDLKSYIGEVLNVSDAVATIPSVALYSGGLLSVQYPRTMIFGENDDELLITTNTGQVIRRCIPGTSCTSSTRDRVILEFELGNDLLGIAVLRLRGTYLLVSRSQHGLFECPLDPDADDWCKIFAYSPAGVLWDPAGILVDELKQLVYATDVSYSRIHTFTTDGAYLGHLEESRGDLITPTFISMKPGSLAALSPISAPSSATAGVPIITNFTLHDRVNNPLPPPSPDELTRYQAIATGYRDGLPTTLTGTVSSSSATITIPFTGFWMVHVMEGIKNPQNLFGSPYRITVHPAETDPTECEAEFEKVVTAGDKFALDIATADEFGNPTEGAEFEFSCCVGEAMTKAGEYIVEVTPAIEGNPFHFDVKSAAPSATTSEHLVSKEEEVLELRVLPKDQFGNTITDATGYAVSIDGGDDIELRAPYFSHTYSIPQGFKGEISLAFTLNEERIHGSPFTISVEAAAVTGGIGAAIAGAVAGALALASLVFCFVHRRYKMAGMAKVAKMADQQQALEEQNEHLMKGKGESVKQIESLKSSLRKKKHSEDELEVMKAAMEGLEDERKDELKEVLIDSSELKVERLLGKGGFGVVNLATYRGQQTAMKQLLTINDDSVKRFR